MLETGIVRVPTVSPCLPDSDGFILTLTSFSGGKRPYVDEMNNSNKLSNNYKDVRMTKKKRAD